MLRRPPRSTLFPDPTLFRSAVVELAHGPDLDLADPFPGDAEPTAHLLQGQGELPLEAEPQGQDGALALVEPLQPADRKSTRLNSSHANISYAVFCLKNKTLI